MTATVRYSAQRVREAVCRANLTRLEWLLRHLGEVASEQDTEPVVDLRDALGSTVSALPTLVDPRLGRWLGRLVAMVERDAPRLLPHGAFRAACLDAGAFAAGARALSPAGWDRPTRVRVGADGLVRLYGTGRWLELPRRLVGATVLVTGPVAELRVVSAAGDELAPRAGWEATPLPGLVAPTGTGIGPVDLVADPLLRSGPPSVVLEEAPFPPAAGLGSAGLGSTGDPPAVVPAPVPAAAAPGPVPGIAVVPVGASASTRLVHVLAAATHLRRAVLEDPMPAGGSPRGCAPARAARASRQARAAPSARWRAAWIAAGGRWRGRGTPAATLPASPELAGVLADLGCRDGIAVNTLADRHRRADPTLDRLGLLWLREPERHRTLAARIERAPECDARALLLGHLAYVERDMHAAATGYARLLGSHPHDVDLWRDLTLALHHLGWTGPGQTWLAHPEPVVARAVACARQVEPLARLVPLSDRCRGAPDDLRFPVGLLEWVRHDLDRR